MLVTFVIGPVMQDTFSNVPILIHYWSSMFTLLRYMEMLLVSDLTSKASDISLKASISGSTGYLRHIPTAYKMIEKDRFRKIHESQQLTTYLNKGCAVNVRPSLKRYIVGDLLYFMKSYNNTKKDILTRHPDKTVNE